MSNKTEVQSFIDKEVEAKLHTILIKCVECYEEQQGNGMTRFEAKKEILKIITESNKRAVEAEMKKIRDILNEVDLRGFGAKMEWLGSPLEGYTAVTDEAHRAIQKLGALLNIDHDYTDVPLPRRLPS